MTFDWSRGRHPELLSGRYYRPLDTAVPQQFFATSMLISPVISGMLGWEPDAPNGRARLAPQLPSDWERFAVNNLMVGGARLGLELVRDEGAFEVLVRHSGQRIDLDLVLSLPPGASEIRRVSASNADQEPMVVVNGRHDVQVSHQLRMSGDPKAVWLRWNGGLTIAHESIELSPGQESRGLRVLDFGPSEEGWSLTVEGEADRRYRLELKGELASVADGPARVISNGGVRELDISFQGESGRSTETIYLRRATR